MKPLLAALSLGLAVTAAHAQVVVSANDAHSVLNQDAKQVLPQPLHADSLSVLAPDAHGRWQVRASVEVPTSVVGPPTAVTVTADGRLALVAAASRPDDAKQAITPDDRLSVIDLSGAQPRVVQQVHATPGVTTLRITPDGRHVLVAGGVSGTLSWYRFDGQRLGEAQVIALPGAPGFPAGLAITPDGRHALVSLWKADRVHVLDLDGDSVRVQPEPIALAPGPWTIRLTPDGRYAVINLLGHGEGKPGGLAVLDLTKQPYRVVQTVQVPNAPEGTDISPDGRYLAVVSQNGSAMPPGSPLYHARGIVTVFALADGHLSRLAQAPATLWPQGLVFAPDGKRILVQGVMDRSLRTLGWDGKTLTVQGDAPLPGGGADIERQR
jgi:DNA-binding beta-propeller fold protein YncE